MKPKRLAESAERAPSPDQCHYQGAVLTRTTSTPTRGRVQPGAGFDPLRGVTRLQPYLRAGPRQLKPALGGK